LGAFELMSIAVRRGSALALSSMFCRFFGSNFCRFWWWFGGSFDVASHHGGWFCLEAKHGIACSWCPAFGEHLPDFVMV